ncbi:DNA/RNA nuclease SfsA [Candidatus Profftia tarda]|uniref:DNA/RNA nuclease SfsA n=1 Tax=Candidatus Profftia tarda TaxID=1177216 RepID=UPI003B969141
MRYGAENSRIDLLLEGNNKPNCYIEAKSVTLFDKGCCYFTDAKTLRGQKHPRELACIAQHGQRVVLCFVVLHTGITIVRPAKHIDQRYIELLTEVYTIDVEIICYSAYINEGK